MNKIIVFLATGAGAGFFPGAPGTAGSALAVILLLFANSFSSPGFIILTGCVVLVGVYSASRAEKLMEKQDPSEVVIDEIAGIFISVAFLPVNGFVMLTAFILFRFFDIAKPWPVRQAEEAGEHLAKIFPGSKYLAKNKGGIGIMLDDIFAGVYANLVLQLLYYFFIPQ